ncbi:hypothetical protein GIB67_014481 [Kingdonia uniflora]|uniref:EDRF1 N-terminal domain-containing protein n=1 Tax=Kingdonia uniflora TaxID=39325 RepID=A0A7J7LZ34_9MAGN|nr:hypothetical protein GIB67_014481 [Kingdonia uniflora]
MEDGGVRSGGELQCQCVGKLEIETPKSVGFLCGTLPVPTDKAFHHENSSLVPSSSPQTVKAPRYRVLPTETDLNTPPLVPNFPENNFPVAAFHPRTSTGDLHWETSATTNQNLARKCEALAVSGLALYGDEIDVVGPADILKQIFKMPYSKARISITVHRIGQALVLNTGPDIDEGEKFVRRHKSQPKSADQSLFSNFAMHSVRVEACDCPPDRYAPAEEQSNSTILPGHYKSMDGPLVSSDHPAQGDHDSFRKNKQKTGNNGRDNVEKSSEVGENSRSAMQEPEKYRRVGNNGFLRVLFWQFHNFRMLLGSDLLLFSNEKYVSVSLHLWDVATQVTPLTWLEAWLDNIMASVPELAICYHQNGVVQGYELLKTDDIFLLKGISEDGTPAFHPQVVQENGLSVLRFLQDNCKQDPGAYWLYKDAGEDVIQLFDLSIIPKSHSSEEHDNSSSSLPSLMHKGRRDSLFSLGILLYRLAHRLSLSMAPSSRAKCGRFFKKCLDFLDEQDHLVLRASAHEQFARLILKCYEELDLTSEYIPLEYEARVTDVEDESSDFPMGLSESVLDDKSHSEVSEEDTPGKNKHIIEESGEALAENTFKTSVFTERTLGDLKVIEPSSRDEDTMTVFQMPETTSHVVETVTDPITSKLAAIHHVSQAIKSLRWNRQLQSADEQVDHGKVSRDRSSPPIKYSVCACGDADCIEICDIREWLPRSKMDHKLWKLVLLLGESYLALGQAYKEDGQLHRVLRVVNVACSIYGSMPRYLDDAQFISTMVSSGTEGLLLDDETLKRDMSSSHIHVSIDRFSSTYLFWANAWTLLGDVYVDFHIMRGTKLSVQPDKKPRSSELALSSEVEKEVKRLKKKLGQFKQNCNMCSLINCSCQSDRASSGNNASSSSGPVRPQAYGRKSVKRTNGRLEVENANGREGGYSDMRKSDSHVQTSKTKVDKTGETITTPATNFGGLDGGKKTFEGKSGGIFRFLNGPTVGDLDYNLSTAVTCYNEAIKTLSKLRADSTELFSVVKKKGWACNELGRNRLERKMLDKAEFAFADAIVAFREVSDHTNIILINCNLGHGRRALAEEMVSKMGNLKAPVFFQRAYNQVLETAKLEYCESLRYYCAARLELNAIEDSVSLSNNLRNDVYTQYANTYLRLGMLLAREDISAEVYENGSRDRRARKELRKHTISANDAIREALSMYESLGDLRKQEAAYAYFQLGCYHRDCCLKFLHDCESSRIENILQKVKQYASLAERNWQKSIDFYGPKTHPVMYLTILIEQSALLQKLSNSFHSNTMIESALCRLLEGRHVLREPTANSLSNDESEVTARLRTQLQVMLKRMLQVALTANSSKSSEPHRITTNTNRSGDIGKLKNLYGMSLKTTDLTQLEVMYDLWMS